MKSGKETKRGEKSRMETMGDAVRLPDNPAPHLTDWLFDIGPLVGGDKVEWRDIAAWEHGVGVVLEPWEARLIRRLSGEYGVMLHRAERADCAQPYVLVTSEAQDRVAAQFKAMVATMKGTRHHD